MIISASRRTDIPAYYADWFFSRIREKFVYVRNPMNPHQISEVSLSCGRNCLLDKKSAADAWTAG